MRRTIENILACVDGRFTPANVTLEGGRIAAVTPAARVDDPSLVLLPGLADVHVHLREPGFSYKETIATGTAAAARGGYTTVCPMPNLDPVPDSLPHLREELDIIARDAVIHTLPYGAITVGEKGQALAELEAMAPYVVAFSDDGHGVQDGAMMREAMLRAKALGKLVVAHCEVNALLRGGYIHDGQYARAHGHAGICSESEWGQIARDVEIAGETGCGYHVCHISTKESVDIIRRAKAEGVDVTCETAPHYLLLDDSDLREEGRFKMNPPLRDRSDREALLEGLADGTIDMIATDHAPHSAEEKARGLKGSAMGIVGIETAFPLLYTYLVKRQGVITLEKLVDLMTAAPARRFGFESGIAPGRPADLAIFDLSARCAIDPETFLSKGRATPFAGWPVEAECVETICGGSTVWKKDR